MAKLYGLGNYLISEITTKLITDNDFSKFVYYKNEDKRDILSLPDLDDPFVQLKGQIFQNRRPEKVLEYEDVCVFIWLGDSRNYKHISKKLKTLTINIGFVVHKNCSKTLNGIREVALISAIEKAIEEDDFQSAMGKMTVDRVNSLNGIPHEWNGYNISVQCEDFSEPYVTYEVEKIWD